MYILTKITAKSQKKTIHLSVFFSGFCLHPYFFARCLRIHAVFYAVFLHKQQEYFCTTYKKQRCCTVILTQKYPAVNVYYCQMSKQTFAFCAFYKKTDPFRIFFAKKRYFSCFFDQNRISHHKTEKTVSAAQTSLGRRFSSSTHSLPSANRRR